MASSATSEAQRLIIVGSGRKELWEPVLASLADQYELSLVDTDYPTWQGAYAPKHRIADITNAPALYSAVADLRGEVANAAVITWNQHSVTSLSLVARKLRLRCMSEEAVRNAMDNLEVRGIVAEEGLPVVPWQLLHHEDDVVGAGESVGYPVVLRPRRRGGPAAAVAFNEGDLREAFTEVARNSARGAIADEGVLVEKYIDGLELNVHSTVWERRAVPVAVARTIFDPGNPLVVTGYTAQSVDDGGWADQVEEVVSTVHRRLGVDWGVTNTRLRITEDGPHPIGVDTWLTGEVIEALGSTGLDVVNAAAAIAFEHEPILVSDSVTGVDQ
jgi:biotin carboxylase